MDDLTKQGSVMLRISHAHPDWLTNDLSYKWGPVQKDREISLQVLKEQPSTVRVILVGPFGHTFTWTAPAVAEMHTGFDRLGVSVAVTWENGVANLYLNGKPIHTASSQE